MLTAWLGVVGVVVSGMGGHSLCILCSGIERDAPILARRNPVVDFLTY